MSKKYIEGTPYPHEVEQDEVHLLNIWYIFYKYKLSIMFSVFIFTATAIGVSFVLPQYYVAKVIVMPSKMLGAESGGGSGRLGGLASLAGISMGKAQQGSLTVTMSILKSRFFINSFLKRHSILPIIFEDDWDNEKKAWKLGSKPGPEKIYKTFSKLFNVSEDTSTPEITISIEWTDAKMAKSWVEMIVSDINSLMKNREHDEATRSLQFLNARLIEVKVTDLKTALLSLIQTETQKLMLADIRREYVLETIDPAILPERPVKPNKPLIAVLGLMIGLLFGLTVAAIRTRNRR